MSKRKIVFSKAGKVDHHTVKFKKRKNPIAKILKLFKPQVDGLDTEYKRSKQKEKNKRMIDDEWKL